MSRFYSRLAVRRHQSVGFALCIAACFAMACGSPAREPAVVKPATNVQSLLNAAQNAERKRDYNTARELYLQAIREAPDRQSAAIANREMASALVFWGEYESAEKRLLASLEQDGKQARVWHDLGLVQDHQDKSASALVSLHKAVALAPKEPRVRIAYAALLVKQSRFSDAIVQYEALLKLPIPVRIEAATHKALQMLKREVKQAP